MPIVGFGFTKMFIERRSAIQSEVSIRNNISISKIETADLMLGDAQQDGLKVTFEFSSSYEPDIADINLIGEVLVMEAQAKAKDVLKLWNDKKEADIEFANSILGNVLNKCNIQALIMSQELGLPAPIPLPRLDKTSEDKNPKKPEIKEKNNKT